MPSETPHHHTSRADRRRAQAHAQDAQAPAQDAAPRRRHRVWPWVVTGIGVVLIGIAIAGAVTGSRFLHEVDEAKASLNDAKAQLKTLSAQVSSGDEKAIQTTADAITVDVKKAAAITDGQLWHLAAKVPFVGQNVDAVQRVTKAVDILVDQALPPGLHVMQTADLKHLTVQGGGINLAPFQQAQSSIPQITAAFKAAEAQIAPINTTKLIPQVSEPIAEILDLIHQATPGLDLVNRYLPTLLDIAGAGGTKNYLVIFQNNAEIRATGGNPSSTMLITLTDGKIHMADQSMTEIFQQAGTYEQQYIDVPAETTKLYLPTFVNTPQDFTFTPDFPTTAALFSALWQHTTGQTVDGVISIDPVVLANLLAVAGPYTLADGSQVTSSNAVKLLLSDVYERYPDPAYSDAFFSDAAQRAFTHLTDASWDPMKMLAALEQSAKEQRIYLHFTDPKAQALATELGVDGALQADNKAETQLGMYLNDSSVGKLEYHLTTGITAQCNASARTITETMTLHNGITDDIQSSYTLGARNRGFGIPRTTMILDVVSFAPPGASIVSTDPATGQVAKWERSGVEKGNTAVSHTVFVPKGQTVTVSYTVKLPDGPLGTLDLRHTPTAHDTPVKIDEASCGSLFAK